jgi:hypothetical protein
LFDFSVSLWVYYIVKASKKVVNPNKKKKKLGKTNKGYRSALFLATALEPKQFSFNACIKT